MNERKRIGVLLANTGTPAAPQPRATRKYLAQYLMDRRIAPMNRLGWWFILHLFILPRRGKKSAEKYQKIWTEDGSPFIIAHKKLESGVGALFAEEYGDDVMVRAGMSYGNPGIKGVLGEMKEAGCTHLVVLPLYPQSAHSTTLAVKDAVQRAAKKVRWDVPVTFIDDYHENREYIQAMAALIKHAGYDPDSGDMLAFSFHSIPLKDIEEGDVYELQCGASSLQIASELGIDRKSWTIGYQCRFDKGREWLTPTSNDVLERWAEAGMSRVWIVCPGFAVDCLETLYDLDHEMKPFFFEKLEEYGYSSEDRTFNVIRCLDRSKAHAKVLHNVIEPHVSEVFHGE